MYDTYRIPVRKVLERAKAYPFYNQNKGFHAHFFFFPLTLLARYVNFEDSSSITVMIVC